MTVSLLFQTLYRHCRDPWGSNTSYRRSRNPRTRKSWVCKLPLTLWPGKNDQLLPLSVEWARKSLFLRQFSWRLRLFHFWNKNVKLLAQKFHNGHVKYARSLVYWVPLSKIIQWLPLSRESMEKTAHSLPSHPFMNHYIVHLSLHVTTSFY